MSKTLSLRIDSDLLARLRAKHGRSLADRVRDAIGGLDAEPEPVCRSISARWSLILHDPYLVRVEAYAHARGITITEAVREIAASLI